MTERGPARLLWLFSRLLPDRLRRLLRAVWVGALALVPDRALLAVRDRYVAELERDSAAIPPALLRAASFHRAIPRAVESFSIPGRSDLRMTNVASVYTQIIFWTGDHWLAQHGAGIPLWEQLCARAQRVVEVGANIGYFTIAGGLASSGTYTAVEPHPNSCAALRTNLALNDVRAVEVVEAAAVPGLTTSSVELVCPTGTDRAAPSGAMVRGSALDPGDEGESEVIAVPAVPFTSTIAGCDLLKIDVEGLEAQLIKDGWDELGRSRPAMMIEVLTDNVDLRPLVIELMEHLGATAYAMHRDRAEPIEASVFADGARLEACHTWDFLFVPAERADLLAGVAAS